MRRKQYRSGSYSGERLTNTRTSQHTYHRERVLKKEFSVNKITYSNSACSIIPICVEIWHAPSPNFPGSVFPDPNFPGVP